MDMPEGTRGENLSASAALPSVRTMGVAREHTPRPAMASVSWIGDGKRQEEVPAAITIFPPALPAPPPGRKSVPGYGCSPASSMGKRSHSQCISEEVRNFNWGEIDALGYLPVQQGFRFSANALGPSTKSSEERSRSKRG